MYIKKLVIQDFRAFQKRFTIHLSKNLTVISGQNGIGKSTILAILANTSELKRNVGYHINGTAFRGEFSDLIIYDPSSDTAGDKATAYFDDIPPKAGYVNKLTYRASIQKNTSKRIKFQPYHTKVLWETFYPTGRVRKEYLKLYKKTTYIPYFKRYRLIPKQVTGKKENTRKLSWPVYYLGLSRLYPAGEGDTTQEGNFKISDDLEKEILVQHKQILGENFNAPTSHFEDFKINDFKKSKTGIRTNDFAPTSNSAGQDNLGQILLTIESFKKLKEKQGSAYIGGLLLIDELDATLHPAAQQRLIEYLYKASLKLSLQLVFTTHSYTLLAFLKNFRNNSPLCKDRSSILINYLTSSYDVPGLVRCQENPKSDWMRLHLTDEILPDKTELFKKVKFFTEDARARWFLTKVLAASKYSDLLQVNLVEVSMPWNSLANLARESLPILPKSIFIFDPDLASLESDLIKQLLVNSEDSDKSPKINNRNGRIFILPGEFAIEKVLWTFISKLSSENSFYKIPEIFNANLNKRTLMQRSPVKLRNKKLEAAAKELKEEKRLPSETDKYKLWANHMGELLDPIADYWIKKHPKEIGIFTDELYHAVLNLE